MIQLGQEQIYRFWGELANEERAILQEQLLNLDMDIFTEVQNLPIGIPTPPVSLESLVPAPYRRLPQTLEERQERHQAGRLGETLLRNGQVGVIIVAGGQGSRLGFHGPKGTMPIGPITGRTIFQHHFEKIRAMERRHGCTLPVYIMTSVANEEQTREFISRHDCFGKEPSSVLIFSQRMLPVFDENKKALLRGKDQLLLAPDGHGGLINAIKHHELLTDMHRRGVEYLFYFQVDNILVRICDPVFLGFHSLAQAEMSAKTVYKRHAHEKIGTIGLLDGTPHVIEYSEMTKVLKERLGADGKLLYGQGSIAIHVFSVSFLRRIIEAGAGLPYHIAYKKVECIDHSGSPVAAMAYKLEQFIFDALPLAQKVVVMETDRAGDFSPIKNDTGEDSVDTALHDQGELYARWLEKCGIRLHRDEQGRLLEKIEISPLFALDEAELAEKLRGVTLAPGDILLEPPAHI